MSEVKQIAEYIRNNDGFAVVCHENPDGDALGSLMAMTRALQIFGKKAEPLCVDCPPYKYANIPGMAEIQCCKAKDGHDHVITVDCADKERLGDAAGWFKPEAFVINIDHHQSNTMFGNINYIDSHSASSAELVYRVMQELGVPLDKELAEYLLVAVSTDTGHFSYTNTHPETLQFAAELIAAGADIQNMSNDVYKRRTEGMTRLIGRAIEHLVVFAEGRAALLWLSQQDYDECGAELADSEGLVDYGRDIDTVEIACFVREAKGGAKASLRSKGNIDVAKLAQTMGGGGHKAAAGLFLKQPLDEAVEHMKRVMTEAL